MWRLAAIAVVVCAASAMGARFAPAPVAAQGAATLWGIDDCDTAQDVLPGTFANLGAPQFIARYLGSNAPCNPYPSLSASEVSYIQARGVSIMLISDPGRFGAAAQQAAQGTSEAQTAISDARAMGVPYGIAIFRDV